MTMPVFTAKDTHIRPITPYDGRHRSLGGFIFSLPDNKWVHVYRDSNQHSNDVDSVMKQRISYDGGATWNDTKTIYDESGIQIAIIQAAVMANGRIGFLTGRRSAGYNYGNPPLWMYSDDEGETWTSVILDGLNHPDGWTGAGHEMYKWPTSIGGDDLTGFMAFSSSIGDPGNKIYWLRTKDNGDTWESGTAVNPIPGVDLSTLAVVRLGTTNRWIMLVRDAEGGINQTNALFFKTLDPFSIWDGPYNTGQMNNNNPHTAVYQDGFIYWLATARTTGLGSRAIPPLREGFVHQWADAELLWASNGTAWPGWSELCNVSGMEGHPVLFTHDNQIYCMFGYNRDPAVDASGTQVGLMGVNAMWPDIPQSMTAPTRFRTSMGWCDRYPDGRQVCQLTLTDLGPIDIEQSSGIWLSPEFDFGDWPLPFVQMPVVYGNIKRNSSGNIFSWLVPSSQPQTEVFTGKWRIARTGTSNGTDYRVIIYADGRWYDSREEG